jgi:NADP-dependent 3-hydroxy acid dehydrogenase YdfG
MNIFKDKLAVITGASSGIGRAIALALANEGAACYLVGRNIQRLEEVAELAQQNTSPVCIYPYDLQEEEGIQNIRVAISRNFGRVDILVHSAGVYYSNLMQDATMEEFDKQYKSNIRGPFLLTQSLLSMIRLVSGQIVFINSSQGLNASGHLSQYASTQHAMKAIADSLREEVNADGVRVLSLFLGRTATPRMESIYQKEGREYNPALLLQPEDVASVVIHSLSLPRTAEVTNISMRPLIKSY